MPGETEKCEMQNREREMEKANKKWIYEMANEEWKTQNGQRKMENAKWRTGDGEWAMETRKGEREIRHTNEDFFEAGWNFFEG